MYNKRQSGAIARDKIWSKTWEQLHKGENPFKFFFLLGCHKMLNKEITMIQFINQESKVNDFDFPTTQYPKSKR